MHIASNTLKASFDDVVPTLGRALGDATSWASQTIRSVPAGARFTVAAGLIFLTHVAAGVLGAHLVHWVYTDLSRPNAAFYGGLGWLAVSLVTWGVLTWRAALWTGVATPIAAAMPVGDNPCERPRNCQFPNCACFHRCPVAVSQDVIR